MSAITHDRFDNFHVMTKPTGPLCNLDCTYCFYLEKEELYGRKSKWAMTDETLESYVRQYIAAQQGPEVTFAWQGGEPTLLGVDFFRQAVDLQKRYAEGKTVHNALQTNGTLLDDEWCEFLAANEFLVGLSIDGPRELHDKYRVDKGNKPTFDRVMRGLEFLKRHGVEFNTLTCVQRHNSYRPLDVYRFLREMGSGYMQFIPIVERVAPEPGPDGLTLVLPTASPEAHVSPWSVEPLQYGKFLSAIFDEWVREDVGTYFVQIFDVALEAWLGMEPSLCVFSETCGTGLALEHNGDLYSCDHYVYPENRLGNIVESPLESLVRSDVQRAFGSAKRDTLPAYCVGCDVRFVCHGECPKHRFLTTPDGEGGLNYLCAGYKHFFGHINPYMKLMAHQLRQGRPASTVMAYIEANDRSGQTRALVTGGPANPNGPCACGSGRKFKKCCGAVR